MQKKVTVICLKYGKKYHPEYVNKLFKMVSRHLSITHDFICITENKKGLNPKIKVIPLDLKKGIKGWWYKPFVFSRDLNIKTETALFLDLDIIIFNSIDKLFTFEEEKTFLVLNGLTSKNIDGINSSCFRFKRSEYFHLYDDYIQNYENIIEKYVGDQDWLVDQIQRNHWPKEWIKSFKHGIMEWPEHMPISKAQRSWEYITKTEPKPHKETAIAVFHGRPNPHELHSRWSNTNWK